MMGLIFQNWIANANWRDLSNLSLKHVVYDKVKEEQDGIPIQSQIATKSYAQCVQKILNEIEKPFIETFAGLNGFSILFKIF